MNDFWTNIAGWMPAVILPLATITQIMKIVRERSASGVSVVTWVMFGVANVGLYVFTEKYLALQSLIGLLGTAILDFVIVGLTVFYGAGDNAVESSDRAVN